MYGYLIGLLEVVVVVTVSSDSFLRFSSFIRFSSSFRFFTSKKTSVPFFHCACLWPYPTSCVASPTPISHDPLSPRASSGRLFRSTCADGALVHPETFPLSVVDAWPTLLLLLADLGGVGVTVEGALR
jgi:hypothetical protein